MSPKPTLIPRPYDILVQRVESGVAYGLRRAFKHVDDPPGEEELERIGEHVIQSLLNELCEGFRLEGEEE